MRKNIHKRKKVWRYGWRLMYRVYVEVLKVCRCSIYPPFRSRWSFLVWVRSMFTTVELMKGISTTTWVCTWKYMLLVALKLHKKALKKEKKKREIRFGSWGEQNWIGHDGQGKRKRIWLGILPRVCTLCSATVLKLNIIRDHYVVA